MRFTVVLLAGCAMLAGAQAPRSAKPDGAAQPAGKTPAAKKAAGAAVAAAKVEPAAAEPARKSKSETLRFSVNWPSGLSLGEGEMTSTFDGTNWLFSYKVDAAVPGFGVSESAKSRATADFCSLELNKKSERGKRVTQEETIFDYEKALATRRTITNNGGKSEINIGSCVRDALTFVHFLRRELAAGRLPQAQPVYYGAGYQTRVQYAGTVNMRSGSEMVEADKLIATIKGPKANFTVDLFFARDDARTPLLAETPLALAKFTVEFMR